MCHPTDLTGERTWSGDRAFKLVSETWAFHDRIVVARNVMRREVGEESVFLNLQTGIYFGADPVATRMWEVLIATKTIQAAFDCLLAEYEVEQEVLCQDFAEFVSKLLEFKLVQVKESDKPSPEKAD